jgi:hypothetical protein
METDLKRTVRDWVWRSAQMEGYAAGIAYHLSRSLLLRPEERDWARDTILPQEVGHRDMLAGLAARLGRPLPRLLPTPSIQDLGDCHALMLLTRAEGALVLQSKKFRAIFQPLGEEALAVFEQILREEQGHRAWSRGVVFRLMQEGHLVPAKVLESFPPFHVNRALERTIWTHEEAS